MRPLSLRPWDLSAGLVLALGLAAVFVLPTFGVAPAWEHIYRPGPAREAFDRLRETFEVGDGIAAVVVGEPPLPAEVATTLATELEGWPEVGAIVGPRPSFVPPGTVAAHGRSAVVYLETTSEVTGADAVEALAERILAQPVPDGVEVHVAGAEIVSATIAAGVERDLDIVIPLVFVAVVLAGSLLLRSWSASVGLGIVLGLAVLFTLGTLGLLYGTMSTITCLVTPIVLTVAAANTVHFVARYRRARREHAPEPAIRRALRGGVPATLLATATTGAGFLALLAIGVPDFTRLGVLGALGCAWTFLAVVGFLPAWLVHTDRASAPRPLPFAGVVGAAHGDLARRGPLAAVVVVVLLLVGAGVSRLSSTTRSQDHLPADSPLPRVLAVLDEDLGGGIVLYAVWTSDDGFRSEAGLDRLRQVARVLEDTVEGVRSVGTAATAVDAVRATLPGLPPAEALRVIESGRLGKIPRLLDESGTTTRLTVRIPSYSTRFTLSCAEDVERVLAGASRPGETHLVTGTAFLVASSMEDIVSGQAWACLLSVAIVSVIASIVLRSWHALPTLWAANVTPLVAMAGVLGWVGEPVSISTAVVGSVVFGLVVDDTLHYLYALREEGDDLEAPTRALAGLGPAFVATSALLVAGALATAIARAPSVRTFGLLMALGVSLALICDLFVAPRVAARLRRPPPR